MDINRELFDFYVYKKLVQKKDKETIIADCERLGVSLRDCLQRKL